MKVLWLSPWFRTLSVAWANGLRSDGHEVVVATTSQHFDAPALHPADILFRGPWRSRLGMAELREAHSYVRRFAPDVVVTEITRDPRFLLLAPAGVPLVITTHDARAHDAANRTPLMRRLSGGVLGRRAALEVCFSSRVKDELGPRRHPVEVLPLTSEMPEDATPELVGPADRRDFFVVGRLSSYKNLPVILEGYRQHQQSTSFRGDRLVVVGGGDPGCPIPSDVEWVKGRFAFADLAPRLAAGKASICLYSAGSQSGVQVLGAQCGVRTLVSEVGGLAEYLPKGEVPLPHRDPGCLAQALDLLADPERAAADGRRHRELYLSSFSNSVTARRWAQALTSVVDGANGMGRGR
ncbi:glycosyltransferase family 4 protein [Gephyromycinifex aptenodytis]|uniref:glycosyltransferase family 4 protein n=1 Tax=Gephyromycinifex aptenodytis TaxID=2716227 RepID=UPI0014453C10|nr:glycosyltransferase family 4 protein [Gephyromycinifex aptenodytis]